ncbi:MAG: hypothetical protein PUB21_04835 [Bacteroidales bacterium]|nr:hypothetical protein [Bacteroidales bacterium]
MGTLGCIDDMLRRDKENRELRKIGRERMKDTRNRLVGLHNSYDINPGISPEELEKIKLQTREKEEMERKYILKTRLLFIGIALIIILLIWIGFSLFL